MCIFALAVNSVTETKILVAQLYKEEMVTSSTSIPNALQNAETKKQLTVYRNTVKAHVDSNEKSQKIVMILPFTVSKNTMDAYLASGSSLKDRKSDILVQLCSMSKKDLCLSEKNNDTHSMSNQSTIDTTTDKEKLEDKSVPDFFDTIRQNLSIPIQKSAFRGGFGTLGIDDSIPISHSGSYSCSVCPTIEELHLLDKSIFGELVNSNLKKLLEKHYDKNFSFLICSSDAKEANFEPLAYVHDCPTDLMFIPTRHFHAGEHVSEDDINGLQDWDHEIFILQPGKTLSKESCLNKEAKFTKKDNPPLSEGRFEIVNANLSYKFNEMLKEESFEPELLWHDTPYIDNFFAKNKIELDRISKDGIVRMKIQGSFLNGDITFEIEHESPSLSQPSAQQIPVSDHDSQTSNINSRSRVFQTERRSLRSIPTKSNLSLPRRITRSSTKRSRSPEFESSSNKKNKV